MPHRWIALGVLCWARSVEAQEWNDPAARRLVARAIEVRQASLADSSLHSYAATAHGFVTFRAEIDAGVGTPSRVVKGDELLAEVYWQRPDRSKQVIRAWRDSTFLPTDLQYHRDHLGIVSDDFGARIRIGEGDEVEDVAHPLSAAGEALYDFRLGDTLRIATGTARITLVALLVRPRDPTEPRVVGTFFLDLDRAVVVRTELSFTPAAYRDRDLEDIAVRLERALVEGRYWLPYRQEIEIRRRSAVVDLPLRGVIRGQWRIEDYRLNEAILEGVMAGPAIGGLLRPGGAAWPVPFAVAADSGGSPGDREAMGRLRSAAAATIRRRLLDGLPAGRVSMSRLSDVLRVNRVEGLRLGAGFSWRGGPVDRAVVRLWRGTSDRRLTGSLALERVAGGLTVALTADRVVRDLADSPVVSQLVNSLAAQEGGRDLGDYYLASRAGLELRWRPGTGAGLVVGVAREAASSVPTRASPARGEYRANPALGGPALWVARVNGRLVRERVAGPSWVLEGSVEVGSGPAGYGRVAATAERTSRVGVGELGLRGSLGVATAGVAVRRSFTIGGTGTVPGERFRGFGGSRGVWGQAEWLVPIPGPAIGLGPWGRTSGRMQVGPFLALGWAAGAVPGQVWSGSGGVRPALGVAMEVFDRAIRIEIGQRMRGGGGPTLSIDVARAFWPLL